MATPPTQSWREDLQASREREPPDCWDVESCDGTALPNPAVRKTWKGAATLIPKVPGTTKKQSAGCKQVGTHRIVTLNAHYRRFSPQSAVIYAFHQHAEFDCLLLIHVILDETFLHHVLNRVSIRICETFSSIV